MLFLDARLNNAGGIYFPFVSEAALPATTFPIVRFFFSISGTIYTAGKSPELCCTIVSTTTTVIQPVSELAPAQHQKGCDNDRCVEQFV